MNRRKLNKIKRDLDSLRSTTPKASDLERLANRLGRKLVKRGRHPMWEREEFGNLYALSIPHHGSKDVLVGTKNSILDQLEDDIIAWEVRLDEEESEKGD